MADYPKKQIYLMAVVCLWGVVLIALSACTMKHTTALDCEINRNVLENSGQAYYWEEYDGYILVDAPEQIQLTVSYQISGARAYQLHSVRVEMHSQAQKLDDGLSVRMGDENDVNHDFITPSLCERDNRCYSVKQLFRFDGSGHCTLTVSYQVKGAVRINDPIICSVTDDDDYYVYDRNRTVALAFLKEDLKTLNISEQELSSLSEELFGFQQSLKWLCSDYEPFNGVAMFVFTENNQYTALAGNPIYVNRQELADLFENRSDQFDKNHVCAVLCHELSHTFDMKENAGEMADYCFDREFFAALKQVYALRENGYDIQYDFLMDVPELSSGIYNYEVLLRRILETLELLDGDWTAMKDTLAALRDLDRKITGEDEKFNAFISELCQRSGISILDLFSETEMEYLTLLFSRK